MGLQCQHFAHSGSAHGKLALHPHCTIPQLDGRALSGLTCWDHRHPRFGRPAAWRAGAE